MNNTTNEKANNLKVSNLKELRSLCRFQYGTLTEMANAYSIGLSNLSHVLHGRSVYLHVVARMQQEFKLHDSQVLKFWPQLKNWPRPGLTEHVEARNARLRGAA